jgi:hypothetical protein
VVEGYVEAEALQSGPKHLVARNVARAVCAAGLAEEAQMYFEGLATSIRDAQVLE